jgi:4-amino-4-deoxy-L-arabinose transferase-like glycosyltransferase
LADAVEQHQPVSDGDGGGPSPEVDDDADRTFRRWLIAIAVIGLVWRVVYVLIWRADVNVWGDSYFYHESAKLIADGKGFVNPIIQTEQAADHPPLYLVFLAGLSWFGLTSPVSHILGTVVVGTATVILAGLAGRELAGRRAGLIAAVLFTVYAGIWTWDGMLLSETFAILFTTLLILLVYRYRRRPSLWRAAGLGAVLGLCTFSRAELLMLSLLVITPVILATRIETWRTRIGWLFAAGATCVLVLSPWVLFNMSRFDQTVTLSAGGEITFATATCDETYYGPFTGYWSMQCPTRFLEENDFDSSRGDQSVRSEIYTRESLTYVREHVDRLPVVVLARWGRITGVWNPVQQAQLDSFPEGRNQWISYLALVQWYPIVALAVVGAVVLRRRRIPIYPLIGPIVSVLVVVTIMFATNRYRAYAEAAIALLAAVGIDAAIRLYRRIQDEGARQQPTPTLPEDALQPRDQ